jgi:cytochrome c oxidase cbb3-type subunit 2
MFSFLEKNPFFFTVAFLAVFSIAGLIEIIPNFAEASKPVEGLKPYSLLETAGRQIYIKDSCNACHSQLIRPFKSETDRYGMYSLSGEYAYDRPFLWGSKRTGPDLHRVGNYRSTDWHENHMWQPDSVVPGSIMPAYKHMFSNNIDTDTAYAEAFTQKAVFGMPYDQDLGGVTIKLGGSTSEAKELMLAEAKLVVDDMKNQDVKDALARGEIKEIVALVAYLNSLSNARRGQ